jgi:UDP-4-amino-4,6-dideoxy-N-acetyl-beta-L-altrosamine N-acetyltransferase
MPDTCTIRLLSEKDLPLVLAWRNHPSVRSYMLTQHEISQEEHRNWFERVKGDKTRQQLIVLDEDNPIGFVQFTSVCQGGISDWGFYLRPGASKGSGRKLGQSALAYAFEDLNLHKVCGQAIECNTASIGFHHRLGFTEEGRVRDQKYIGNHHHTLFCFGLLAKDWKYSQQK